MAGRNCWMSSDDYPYPGAPPGWFVHCSMCNDGYPHITVRHKPLDIRGNPIYDQYDFSFHFEVKNGRERYWLGRDMNQLLRLRGLPLNQVPGDLATQMRNWYYDICVNADHNRPNIKTAQYRYRGIRGYGYRFGKKKINKSKK